MVRILHILAARQTGGAQHPCKARVKAHALHEIIESRENVIIMGHSLTDVDSLGAGIGIFCAARVLGKRHRS